MLIPWNELVFLSTILLYLCVQYFSWLSFNDCIQPSHLVAAVLCGQLKLPRPVNNWKSMMTTYQRNSYQQPATPSEIMAEEEKLTCWGNGRKPRLKNLKANYLLNTSLSKKGSVRVAAWMQDNDQVSKRCAWQDVQIILEYKNREKNKCLKRS